MEKLIPLFNKLQEVLISANISHIISLPQIVVVGSQSSGKSSVLESIVGKDFLPRGSGIVTKCPLRLKLVKTQESQEYGIFSHIPDSFFDNFDDIREEIKNRTTDLVGNGRSISTQPIDLTIYSPNVLDITMVDLPGIVKISVSGQSRDIETNIRDMILQYISNPDTIILAISAANNDLANSDALQLAHLVDPNGERTIGVLTKIDIMDRGTDAVDMLNGTVFPLRLGYVGVVCRSQEDINKNVPMKKHLAKEEKFFRESPVYARYADRLGIRYLTMRLNKILQTHINNSIPTIKKKVNDELEANISKLREYGEALSTRDSKTGVLLSVIQKVAKSFQENIEGKNVRNVTEELMGGARINYIFHQIFVSGIAKIDPLQELSDQNIRTAVMNATGLGSSLFIPESAFEILIKSQIPKLHEPSLNCMNLIYEELKNIIYKIEIPELERFKKLKDAVSDVINQLLASRLKPTRKMIDRLIDVEGAYINTHHPQFIGGSKALIAAQTQLKPVAQEPIIDKSIIPPPLIQKKKEETIMTSSSWFSFRSQETPKIEQEEEKIPERQKISFDFMSPPSSLQPSSKMTNDEKEQIEMIKILIKSYFDIVRVNIGDLVPKTIMGFLVNRSKDELQRELVKKLYKEECDELLEESDGIAQERETASQAVDGLRRAIHILNEVREYKINE
ncbi:unnamed protein product [Blepharisma stoltei]|uniref:Uncharacterized protein n=1 Tax=Blepharisma stoltei TaxID=1481888 RepID=A0AAU9IKW7_9CILI|nr:unnamed protein product [Blepharisma stoltei]